jgi:hypothetical protein
VEKIIRVSGCKTCFDLAMASRFLSSPTAFNFAGLAPQASTLLLLRQKKVAKEKATRSASIPAPAILPKARLNSHRATVTVLKHAAA